MDPTDTPLGLVLPKAVATLLLLLITGLAVLRHLRLALQLRPIAALM